MPVHVEEASDELLLARYVQGDEAAFAQLVERYRVRLFHYLYRLVGHRHTAEDLLQETFVRVVTHSWRFCADYTFCTWIYTIATNLAANELRKKKRRTRETFVEEYPPLPAPGDDPGEIMSLAETVALLTRCLGQLDDAHRTVFLLRVSEGMPYEEIARIVGCPATTARTRMFHAITRLRQEMGLTEQEGS